MLWRARRFPGMWRLSLTGIGGVASWIMVLSGFIARRVTQKDWRDFHARVALFVLAVVPGVAIKLPRGSWETYGLWQTQGNGYSVFLIRYVIGFLAIRLYLPT